MVILAINKNITYCFTYYLHNPVIDCMIKEKKRSKKKLFAGCT
jgi:hypothetical protein